MDWASSCKAKGHRFDHQSGHMPGLQARGLGACERQLIHVSLTHPYFSPFLSPFLPLSLKINKIFKTNKGYITRYKEGPSSFLFCIYLKKPKTLNQRQMYPYVHCGTVSNSQTRWKQLQHPSIDGPRSAARVQRNTTRP